jgi:hypothetical protein
MPKWKCSYCGRVNAGSKNYCGEGARWGCGAKVVEVPERALVGGFEGKLVYDDDSRLPSLRMHENFMLALGP